MGGHRWLNAGCLYCPVRAARTNLLTRPLKRSKASACGAEHSQNCAI